METPSYIALSRQMTLQRQMDVIANNIANMNTGGFKQERTLFSEYLKKPAIQEQTSLVQDRGTYRDLSGGALTATGNNLDIGLNGPGYITVDTVNGPRYTRGGRLQLNQQRQITDANGLPILGTNNQPISVPASAGQIIIDTHGSVTTNINPKEPIGQFKIVRFDQEQRMISIGNGMYTTEEQPKPAGAETIVQQGVLEESNVKPIIEMTSMIEVARQYQQNQKLIESEHERVRGAISRLGRTT
ncbi:Flagellar basal-body rod protein FlgF [Azospirillaceae bacterium]